MVTNGERLIKLETQMGSLKDDILEIKEILKEHVAHEDKAYAGKWTENTIIGLIVAVGGAIITWIITRGF